MEETASKSSETLQEAWWKPRRRWPKKQTKSSQRWRRRSRIPSDTTTVGDKSRNPETKSRRGKEEKANKKLCSKSSSQRDEDNNDDAKLDPTFDRGEAETYQMERSARTSSQGGLRRSLQAQETNGTHDTREMLYPATGQRLHTTHELNPSLHVFETVATTTFTSKTYTPKENAERATHQTILPQATASQQRATPTTFDGTEQIGSMYNQRMAPSRAE